MKAILILLLLAGLGAGGFYGYQYLEKEGKLPWQTKPEGGEVGVEKPPEKSGTDTPDDPDNRVAPPGEVKVPEGDPISALYPLPEFQTLEKLTEDWTKLPPRAFPRIVTTKEPVKMEIAPGAASSLPAGKKMTALGMEDGMIVLALDPNSTARAKAPATATTIVDQIAERYEIFKKEQTDRVMAQRKSEKDRREAAKAVVASSGTGTSDPPAATARPAKTPSEDPRFKPMVDSIRSGDSREIEMKNIQSWRWGGKTKEGGQEYDYGLITYSVDTLFGTMDTEAMALIKNGKVRKWVYTGSGDEVP